MSVFDTIIKNVLPTLESGGANILLKNLESAGAEIALPSVSKELSHVVLKAIDGVVAAAVKTLPKDDVEKLAHTYMGEIDSQVITLGEAVEQYIPLQVAVEVAKKLHGDNSAEANAAREARTKGIDLVRKDIDSLFGELLGKHISAKG